MPTNYILTLRYNVKNSPHLGAYKLSAKTSKNGKNVEICTKYQGFWDKSGMAVVEMELLSGFGATPPGIESLKALEVVQKVIGDYCLLIITH